MIKTVLSEKNENGNKVYTVYNNDFVPVWTSKEYRIDAELVKHNPESIVFRTRLGYEAYKLVPWENGFVSLPLNYKDVMTKEEISKFDEYYNSIYMSFGHPEEEFDSEFILNRVKEAQTLLMENKEKFENEKKEFIQKYNNKMKEAKEKCKEFILVYENSMKEKDEQIKKLTELLLKYEPLALAYIESQKSFKQKTINFIKKIPLLTKITIGLIIFNIIMVIVLFT